MAAAQGRVPADFLPTPGEPVAPWLTWKRGFLNYLEATDAESFPPKRKRAILLSFLGEEGNRVVDAFNLAGPAVNADQDEFQVLLSALDTHFASAQNVVVERRKFVTRVQGPGETVLEYLGALRRLASFCDYGESLESRVAEMFISGIRNTEVQDRLIRESGGANAPSLERAVQLAQQFERTSRDCDLFRRLSLDATSPNTPHVVDRVQDGRGRDRDGQHGGQSPRRRESSPPRREPPPPPPPSPSTREPSHSSPSRREPPPPSSGRERSFPPSPRRDYRRESRAPSRPFFGARRRDPPPGASHPVREGGCYFCGRRSHPREECPASGAACFSCGRVGHFANVCRSRPRGDRDQRQLALPAGRRASARGYYERRQAGPGPTGTPVQGVGMFSDDDDELRPSVFTVGSPGGRQEQRPGFQRRSFTADLEVNGFPLSILIDTGAEVSILSDATFNRINRSGRIRLSKPPRTLVHYLKGSIPVLGCFHANVVFKGRFATILFYVVRNGRSLLGVDAVHDLKMILSGVPLKCFHVDAAAPGTAVPGHLTEAEVPQPSSTADSSPSTHFSRAFGTSSSAVPTAQVVPPAVRPAPPEPPVPVPGPASPDTTNPDPEGPRPDSGLSPVAPPLPESPVPAGSPLPLPEGPAEVWQPVPEENAQPPEHHQSPGTSPDNSWSEASWSSSRTETATEGASCDSPAVLVPSPEYVFGPRRSQTSLLFWGVPALGPAGACRLASLASAFEGFIFTEASNIECTLHARACHYQQLPGVSTLESSSCNFDASLPGIRDIHDVVQEEIRKLPPAISCPAF
ncbi:hypothetical protein HPB47_012444 [Ixodes persulcatus]|uniref:Uncharacterized protein n=1 Tax=Ixodes persulcatus TaxID=34615 RepID=A0AC60NTI0_IXOPE|nr:hypothetical protein HPB47_012444 [Ixodes persulcatus]